MPITPADYRHLSVEERLELVTAIWDTIAEDARVDPALLPFSDAEREELKRRVAEDDANPEAAIHWEQAMAEIERDLAEFRARRT